MARVLVAVEYYDIRDEPGQLDIKIIAVVGDSYRFGPVSVFYLTIQPINDHVPVLDLSANENTTVDRIGTVYYYEGSGAQTFSTDPSIFDADLNTPFEVSR